MAIRPRSAGVCKKLIGEKMLNHGYSDVSVTGGHEAEADGAQSAYGRTGRRSGASEGALQTGETAQGGADAGGSITGEAAYARAVPA